MDGWMFTLHDCRYCFYSCPVSFMSSYTVLMFVNHRASSQLSVSYKKKKNADTARLQSGVFGHNGTTSVTIEHVTLCVLRALIATHDHRIHFFLCDSTIGLKNIKCNAGFSVLLQVC